MNIFSKYTRKSLLKNKMRTFITIVGIVLSVALSTAVVQGGNSGVEFFKNAIIKDEGSWEVFLGNMTDSQYQSTIKDKHIKESISFDTVGWSEIGSTNDSKPYLLVKTADKEIVDYAGLFITKGRVPENSNEILLPNHLERNGGVSYKIGDKLTLNVGERQSDGSALSEFKPYYDDTEEEIVNTKVKEYEVVGFYNRLSYDIEAYMCPGYTAITTGDTDYICRSAFAKLKNPGKIYEDIRNGEMMEANTIFDGEFDYDLPTISVHDDLVKMYGGFRSSEVHQLMTSFVAILLIIIAFGSIALIYNSFSISVSERTKQFGILKSIGATKRQIRKIVLKEALYLSIIAIPFGLAIGCAGIGATLYLLRDSFDVLLGAGNGFSGLHMTLSISPMGLVVVSVICIVTTLISAYIPARRAMRLNPIDAVRMNSEIKIKRRAVKPSFFARKFFGFEGLMASKNFKRSKKKYRATVISLFVSIVLFVSASSFCDYLNSSLETITSQDNNADVALWTYYVRDDSIVGDLKNMKNTKEVLVASGLDLERPYIEYDKLSKDFKKHLKDMKELYKEDYYDNNVVNVIFLDTESFDKLCDDNKIKAHAYHDTTSPKGLLYNQTTEFVMNENKDGMVWKVMPMVDEKQEDIVFHLTAVPKIENYQWVTTIEEPQKEKQYLYVSEEILDEYINSDYVKYEDDELLNDSNSMLISDSDFDKIDFVVGDIIEKLPYVMGTGNSALLIYPEEMQKALLDTEKYDNLESNTREFLYLSENPSALVTEIENYIDSFESNQENFGGYGLENSAEDKEVSRALSRCISAFAYGFIVLISLIALANVFNSIATNVNLRKREFAMLKTVGMGEKSFRKMMSYECLIYGFKSLIYGLPAAVLATYGIYRSVSEIVDSGFYIPWYSLAISVGSVFVVVFATMIYATRKLKKENMIDNLKSEIL